MKLKVCGMREQENIQAIGALAPQYMGFIFYPQSKRFVGSDFKVPKNFPEGILKVGVFVNAAVDAMERQIVAHRLDLVQLHGDESVETCKAIRKSARVIKVFSVDQAFDFNDTKPFGSAVDYFMFDTKGKNYGGNGVAFDWNVLAEYDQQIPFFLSGGLSQENVAAALSLKGMNLHALDINSGVEDSPGMKNVGQVSIVRSMLNTDV